MFDGNHVNGLVHSIDWYTFEFDLGRSEWKQKSEEINWMNEREREKFSATVAVYDYKSMSQSLVWSIKHQL